MANSVTARFNDDCKVFVSMSDDTTVEKAVIIDAEGNETDIGGGGGSSDFDYLTKHNNIAVHGPDDDTYGNIVLLGLTYQQLMASNNTYYFVLDNDQMITLDIPLPGNTIVYISSKGEEEGAYFIEARFLITKSGEDIPQISVDTAETRETGSDNVKLQIGGK